MIVIYATCFVLENVIKDGNFCSQKSEADGAYDIMTSFEFVFILHLMRELLGIINDLSQDLQLKSHNIMNAMHLVSLTKKTSSKI